MYAISKDFVVCFHSLKYFEDSHKFRLNLELCSLSISFTSQYVELNIYKLITSGIISIQYYGIRASLSLSHQNLYAK